MQYETKSGLLIDFEANVKPFHSRGDGRTTESFMDYSVEIHSVKVFDEDGNELPAEVHEHFMSALEQKAIENYLKHA